MTVTSTKRLRGLHFNILTYLALMLVLGWPLKKGAIGSGARGEVGLNIGNLAPDFVLPDMIGKQVKLSTFRGKNVILNFWSTWCKPCIEEMPDMQTFYNKNNMEGIEILAVSINRERDSTVSDFVEKLNLTFPILLDYDKLVAREYKVFVLPTSFLINEKGIIAKKWYGKIHLDGESFLLDIRKAAVDSP
jgi:peroxiredoxin